MKRYVNWVEAEWAGDFACLDSALQEAVITANAREAEVIVADELTDDEWVVQVCRRAHSAPSGMRDAHSD